MISRRHNSRKIECSVCGALFIYDYFKKHCAKFHPNEKAYAREIGDVPVSNFFSSTISTKVSTYIDFNVQQLVYII